MKTDTKSLERLSQIFKEKWDIDLHTYEDQYHRTDMWFDWKGQPKDIEVKRRRFDREKYPTTIVDADKFVELCKKNACLVVMFNDKWGICKDVRKAFIKVTQMWARRCTDFAADYYWKNMAELDLNEFTWFEY